MGLFDWLTKPSNNTDNGLTPEENEEVEKGNYEPFNFEEKELEDDDYYAEDDVDEEEE